MSKQYDVIVVGAGIGGLSAAARLVQAGMRVLVVEKSPHPGGTAYVYVRKGFCFPMGPLGFSSPGFVNRTLTDLGVPFEQAFGRVHYAIHAFGQQILLSQSFSALSHDLKKAFPDDVQGIDRFFKDMAQTLSAMEGQQNEKNRALLEKTKSTAAREYLESLITDWRLRRFLGSLGTHEPYSSIPLMAAMWNLMSCEGIWYPPGGMRSLSDRLARAVTRGAENARGTGEISLGTTVKSLQTKKGRVTGITLNDGRSIEAKAVISNTDFKTTFLNLMQPECLPSSWRNAVVHARQTGSVMQVCLGLDPSNVDFSVFSRASRLLYRKAVEPNRPTERKVDWSAPEIDGEALTEQEMELALMTHEDPSLAPDGKAVMVIRTEADHAHFTRFRSPTRRRISAYQAYKNRLAQALMAAAEKIIPGLMQAVEVMDVATPLTFEDQGGRSQGAVAGWSWDYEDTSDYVPLDLTRTPIQGLFMAGYQAYSALFMGGVPTAIESGRKAARAVLQEDPPTQDVPIPGRRQSV